MSKPSGLPCGKREILAGAAALAAKIKARSNDTISEYPVKPLEFCEKFTSKFHHVLSPDECAALIKLSEAAGYEKAMVNVGFGKQILRPDYRDSHRVMIDSPELADAIFGKIKLYLRNLLKCKDYTRDHTGTCYEFNERLRFLRYTGGEFFSKHFDGRYRRDNGDTSFLTVLVYLNDGYNGATRVLNTNRRYYDEHGEPQYEYHDVKPEVGMCFVHAHDIYHSGQPITGGTKYVIRTDIMFTTRPEAIQKVKDEAEAAKAAVAAALAIPTKAAEPAKAATKEEKGEGTGAGDVAAEAAATTAEDADTTPATASPQ